MNKSCRPAALIGFYIGGRIYRPFSEGNKEDIGNNFFNIPDPKLYASPGWPDSRSWMYPRAMSLTSVKSLEELRLPVRSTLGTKPFFIAANCLVKLETANFADWPGPI